MNKIENLIDMAKLNELLGKKEEKKNKSNVLVRFFAPSVFLLTIIFIMEQILLKINDVCWMTCEE